MIHTLQFSDTLEWTVLGGWSFTKTGVNNQTVTQDTPGFSFNTLSPSDLLEFNVPWTIDPLAGERVTVTYNGLGDFYKEGGDPEDDKMQGFDDFRITNCLDSPSQVGIVESWTGLKNCGVTFINLETLRDHLLVQGWSVTASPTTLAVDGQEILISYLMACDFSGITPGSLRHDLCQGIQAQGFCLNSGNCN